MIISPGSDADCTQKLKGHLQSQVGNNPLTNQYRTYLRVA